MFLFIQFSTSILKSLLILYSHVMFFYSHFNSTIIIEKMILHLSRSNIYVNPHNNKFGKERNDHILSWIFLSGVPAFPQNESWSPCYPTLPQNVGVKWPLSTSQDFRNVKQVLYRVQERSVTRLAHGMANTYMRNCLTHKFSGPTVDFFSKFRSFHRMIEKTIERWRKSTSEHYSQFLGDHPALGCFLRNYL